MHVALQLLPAATRAEQFCAADAKNCVPFSSGCGLRQYCSGGMPQLIVRLPLHAPIAPSPSVQLLFAAWYL
jgi:hypothetical protein